MFDGAATGTYFEGHLLIKAPTKNFGKTNKFIDDIQPKFLESLKDILIENRYGYH